MLLELLFGTPAGLLSLLVIVFMVCMGLWLGWMFIRKSSGEAGSDPGDAGGNPPPA